MNHPILGSLALGYAPLIDPQRVVNATRLSVVPLRPDLQPDAGDLLAAIGEVWPADGSAQLVLSIRHEELLKGVLAAVASPRLMVEVPAFMAADPALADTLRGLKSRGQVLLLKGIPSQPLDPAVKACFKSAVLDLDEEPRAAQVALPRLVSGLRGAAAVDGAFKRGAQGVIGWPVEGGYDAPVTDTPGRRNEVQADLQVIVELMSRVDQGDDVDRLEQTLKRDPSLAFKLLRYMNSAAFGLSVEVSSFRHALMLLGYSRLKRWLALLLTTASKDHTMRPVMYGALRRGLMMEELGKSMDDAEMRDEMFVCGLFSLLDHMLKQPFARLLQSIPVPERVRQALVDETGPYQPYLELVRALEAESIYDYRSATEQLMLGASEVNSCLLNALSKATHLE
ncbi:MAG: HDOD domain-containing protein [Paucibacter sp.]|nr:HDOD domain-containing protein [Roseateles sp.]